MACVIAMYKTPVDPAAFDRDHYATHLPIARKIAGLRRYDVTTSPVSTLAGPAPYHLVGRSDLRLAGGDPGGARLARRTGDGGGPPELRHRRRRTRHQRHQDDLT